MKEKVSQITSIITIPLLLILGTVGVYLYAKGYRLNIPNGSLEKTGVISVKTIPRRADISIDGESKGRTPKTVSGVALGKHTVEISRDGYFPWSLDVSLEAEELIPLTVSLFLREPETQDIFPELNEEETAPARTLLGFETDTGNILTLFTTVYEADGRSALELWSYPTKRRFWEITVEPVKIAEFPSSVLPGDFTEVDPILSTKIAPNGGKVLVQLQHNDTARYYVLETSTLNQSPEEFSDLNEHSAVTPTWSNNSNHIMYSKNGELRSINTETRTNTIITEQATSENETAPGFVWNTNGSGQIYYLSKNDSGTDIIRTEPNGSGQITLLSLPDEIPASEGQETSDEEGAADNDSALDPREITALFLTPEEEHILLFHPEAIILYTVDSDTYQAFFAEAPQFLGFSPDEEKFLYQSGETTIRSFRFIIEEGDPLHYEGPKTLIEVIPEVFPSGIEHISWHPESTNLLFSSVKQGESSVENGPLYAISILDTESLQVYNPEITLSEPEFSIDSSGKFFIGQCTDEAVCSVTLSE